MSLHIIIDGYNLIRQSPDLSAIDTLDMEAGRYALIDSLAAYKRIKAHKITVVFDGTAAPSYYQHNDKRKGIEIRFSMPGETADRLIKSMAAKKKERALVVSSDNEILAFAEAAGAAVITSPAFEARITRAIMLEGAGPDPEDDTPGWRPTTKKKGPSRRLPKKKRKSQKKIRKL
ncbi:MAG: NYN domain-containing protein [Thermodesulfobacteriota bacterium]|nr:NYN domain-containing protein [Thermodesulfobacteriota bacterium]